MPRLDHGGDRRRWPASGQSTRRRRTELGVLCDLYGDAVYRCAVFVGGPDDAEMVTMEAFRTLWNQRFPLDHRDPVHRTQLIRSCVLQITGSVPDVRSAMTGRAALAVVVFGRSTYRAAAEMLGVSETYVLDRLDEAMRRDLMGLDQGLTSHSASGVGANA